MQREGAWGYVMSPVTMVTMATMLRDRGFEVRVVDAGVDVNDFGVLAETVRSFAPELVFVNTSTTTIEDDLYATAFLKAECPSVRTAVLYGIHVSVLYEDVLRQEAAADACVVGEPELTVLETAEALRDGRPLAGVAGLAYREGDRVVRTAERGFIEDLDILPIPDWSFVDLDHYRLPFSGERFLLVNTNRGCPYLCTFCNAYVYYGRKPRRRSVGHIVAELRNDVERFGVRNFMIWTEEFILDKAFVKDLCRAIVEANLDIRWVCNSRVDAVDEEVLRLVKAAGCWNIAYGIESGVQEILDAVKKRTTLEQIRRAVRLAKEAGLQVTGHVIIGFPEDTRETVRRTEAFVRSLDLDFVQYYCAMPYPGTELYERARREGWINATDWRLWEHNYSVLDMPNLKAREIMRLRSAMFRRHYFRPKVVWRTLTRHIRRPKDVLTFLRNVREFLKWM